MTDAPELIAGRYALGEIIGSGGMSEVYAATDTVLGRDVAVKMLRRDLARDINFRERFRREAQNSGKLNHPAIVAVFDTGEQEIDALNTPYIVMERVHGRTLRDIVRESGPMAPAEAARTLIPVAQALQASHDAGIIHRDIKPANVMITNTGSVKVMDFGIARALDDATSAMTQTSAVIGTAQYLSPEQARGKLADARSDVYALGCVLYETLTGRPPFEGDTPFAVAYQHVQEEPTRPSEFIADISPTAAINLDAVVLTAMAKHPADRYQTARAMEEDLERLERSAVTEAARHYIEPGAGAQHDAPAANPEPDPAAEPRARHRASERSSNRGLKAVAAVLSLIILGVGGAFAYEYFNGSSINRQMVEIPDVTGQTEEGAVRALEELSLQVNVVEQPSPSVPRGIALGTNPTPGSSVREGTTVQLTVSSGREVTEVPDLAGLNTADAAKALADAGLELDPVVREEASETVAEGQITQQQPSAGSQVSRGSRVVITVSTGLPTERVPLLVGQTWQQAQENLASLGFNPVAQYVDSIEPEGRVVAVNGEGSQASEGATITVQVSNGMLMRMPSITRLEPAAAVGALRAAGWTGDPAQLRQGNPIPTAALVDQGLIATQSPEQGALVRKDADIPISVYNFDLSVLGR
ncbi:Stk1 family PASTA domain-containing Ser/Thr kinase [Corynebacterium sp. 153RC1]|uniref:Stk1 family PASTA domain-containing Ser/Thr kinase n=1 Tax=unclassified Corynebacterium TaxID=2624378 RepID=UPI00211C34E1|nr:Stk1 family PASTA domain-containing Ser/Thr kinase [Corynebacterium sp. 209RC1]MCQ9354915.1 Stk1 family PASTA domain-containing Ser/Thr kinase [Corynebacterium sp. 1222RC1]MCQ9357176.1 Stk1 family PASTA domain-containing Ser/Thr kinase [Corynebacterium sp. 122RC1]MCQ9359351.1 Stk1 family PASTA domain-containing Ser/Thr kinase [Corynebacterium sp. 142RC1]MCQ9361573.1 Stk1 family PASTA domain-containing Ser/Thr kinase [Corynebacterium sp. 153RC1]MCQ9363698.1 Stk1 family PASTA domain-containin